MTSLDPTRFDASWQNALDAGFSEEQALQLRQIQRAAEFKTTDAPAIVSSTKITPETLVSDTDVQNLIKISPGLSPEVARQVQIGRLTALSRGETPVSLAELTTGATRGPTAAEEAEAAAAVEKAAADKAAADKAAADQAAGKTGARVVVPGAAAMLGTKEAGGIGGLLEAYTEANPTLIFQAAASRLAEAGLPVNILNFFQTRRQLYFDQYLGQLGRIAQSHPDAVITQDEEGNTTGFADPDGTTFKWPTFSNFMTTRIAELRRDFILGTSGSTRVGQIRRFGDSVSTNQGI